MKQEAVGGEQKAKKQKGPAPVKKVVDNTPSISKLDIRVGKITKAWPNPDSEKLYNEEIDMGNGEMRTIASGL